MNLGLSKKLEQAFPNIIPKVRPLICTTEIPNPLGVAGFTNFFIYIYFIYVNKKVMEKDVFSLILVKIPIVN